MRETSTPRRTAPIALLAMFGLAACTPVTPSPNASRESEIAAPAKLGGMFDQGGGRGGDRMEGGRMVGPPPRGGREGP